MSDFYLGKQVDPTTGEKTDARLLYDSDDLTTHGVIVGMTGSGKTGLCLDLMEEAALNKIPALMIDPKGDITNALLHFPDLLPSDFRPWINETQSSRSGKSADDVAAQTADLWRNGLADWDIHSDRIQQLKDSVQFAIYTPGSDAGIPISIISSLAAPKLDWNVHKESLREQISGTVTALLGLVGRKNIDPVRDREHILLSNIFESAWSKGQDLTLGDLIMNVQNPPFEKLGFFPVSQFFPDKDRMELALELNNILASPSFQSWIEGDPLDIQQMFYMPDGTPRHTIFYIAHLNDAERMFFVTLLYGAVETWMRQQSGTSSLRALVYFDEIFGYLPPSANPPSKTPMLRLLKQARAFGLGMVLATQNPVDIDYKALSNAGTWFIGKLGTDQDKQRLLDGLETATGEGASRAELDRMISALGKRVFLLRNVHEKAPKLFQTRWAMNYLAGPVTRSRIPELNQLANARPMSQLPQSEPVSPTPTATSFAPPPPPTPSAPKFGTDVRPKVPARVSEYFLPQNLSLSQAIDQSNQRIPSNASQVGMVYHATLLAQAHVRILNRKYDIDIQASKSAVIDSPDRRGMVRWEEFIQSKGIDDRDLDRDGLPDVQFGALEAPLSESTVITSMKKDFQDWIYRNTEVTIYTHDKLGVSANAGEMSPQEFQNYCIQEAQDDIAAEEQVVEDKFEKQLDKIEKRLQKERRDLAQDEDEYEQRKREEGVKHLETVIGMFMKRRRSLSGSMSKRRMTANAKAAIEETQQEIAELEDEIRDIQREAEDALAEVRVKWEALALEYESTTVQPFKKDILIDLFGVAWMPYYILEENGRYIEIPAFG